MKSVYPVFLTQTNTIVLVEVPDLEILTEGKDIPDAIEMARDAIELKCVSLEDEGINIPQPTDISTLNVNAGTFAEEGKTIVSLVDVNPAEYRKKLIQELSEEMWLCQAG